MTNPTQKTALTVLAGLALASSLAACSAPAASDSGSSGSSDSGSSDSGSTGSYADGTYTESGDYQAPSGTETVEVTVTLAGGVVSDVEVTGDATDGQAKLYQGKFIAGIADAVVGKALDDIAVDKVGGSSLTSGGFMSALDAIKADAAA